MKIIVPVTEATRAKKRDCFFVDNSRVAILMFCLREEHDGCPEHTSTTKTHLRSTAALILFNLSVPPKFLGTSVVENALEIRLRVMRIKVFVTLALFYFVASPLFADWVPVGPAPAIGG